jgi:hypothetical protein
MVRDLFHTSGQIEFNDDGEVMRIMLNKAALHVKEISATLSHLVSKGKIEHQDQLTVRLKRPQWPPL